MFLVEVEESPPEGSARAPIELGQWDRIRPTMNPVLGELARALIKIKT